MNFLNLKKIHLSYNWYFLLSCGVDFRKNLKFKRKRYELKFRGVIIGQINKHIKFRVLLEIGTE